MRSTHTHTLLSVTHSAKKHKHEKKKERRTDARAMSLWGKDEAAPGDVRRFWLAPLCAAGPSLHAQRTAAAQHIAWLLDTDTALRKGAAAAAAASVASAGSADASTGTSSAAAEEEAAPTVVLPRRLGAPDDEEAGAVAVGAVPETSARVLGALHFAVLFWPYDAQQPRLRRAYDAWHAAVRQTPLPADTRWAVSSEVRFHLLPPTHLLCIIVLLLMCADVCMDRSSPPCWWVT